MAHGFTIRIHYVESVYYDPMMTRSDQPFARSVHTQAARLDPTIWRATDVTTLIDRARAGGFAERNELLAACVERFQFLVRRIVREDGFARIAPSGTEVVHTVFFGDMQAVFDSESIGAIHRRDLELLFQKKVRQYLKKLVEKQKREMSGVDAQLDDRLAPGSDRIPQPDVVVERIEREEMLLDAMDAYPDEAVRDLLLQRYYFGRTLAELSAMTGESVSTLHSRIRTAELRLGRSCIAGLVDGGRRHDEVLRQERGSKE
jgi:hypothetical protein